MKLRPIMNDHAVQKFACSRVFDKIFSLDPSGSGQATVLCIKVFAN